MHVAMHDRRAERRAALAGRSEAAEQRALDGQVEVGVGHDDERVLAAELEARRLEVPAAELAEATPHLGGAGEADLVQDLVVEGTLDPLERLRPVRDHELERAPWEPGVQDQLREGLGGRRRVLGGFPDDRVPAQQGGHEVPRRDRDGEVAGGHDRGDADGRAEREELLVRHLRRDRLPVEPAPLTEEEVARVDDLLDLAARLPDRLADLARDQLRERLEVLLDEPPELLDRPASDRRRDVGPRRLRRLRAPARLEEGRGVGELRFHDRLVEMSRVRDRHGAARRALDGAAVEEGGNGAGGGHAGDDATQRPVGVGFGRERTGYSPDERVRTWHM